MSFYATYITNDTILFKKGDPTFTINDNNIYVYFYIDKHKIELYYFNKQNNNILIKHCIIDTNKNNYKNNNTRSQLLNALVEKSKLDNKLEHKKIS